MSEKLTKQDITYRDLFGEKGQSYVPKGKKLDDVAIPALTFVEITCSGCPTMREINPENLSMFNGMCIDKNNIMEL